MKLYEISNEIQKTLEHVNEYGEITDEQMETITNLNQSFEEKAISVAAYIKNLQAESEAVNKAMNEMRYRRDKIDNNIEELSEYLKVHLSQNSINEIKSSPYFKIKLKKCPPSVEVFREEEIPEEYWQERVTKVLSKRNILDDLKAGVYIEGVTIKNNLKLEIK